MNEAELTQATQSYYDYFCDEHLGANESSEISMAKQQYNTVLLGCLNNMASLHNINLAHTTESQKDRIFESFREFLSPIVSDVVKTNVQEQTNERVDGIIATRNLPDANLDPNELRLADDAEFRAQRVNQDSKEIIEMFMKQVLEFIDNNIKVAVTSVSTPQKPRARLF